jgi:hypothetical protein
MCQHCFSAYVSPELKVLSQLLDQKAYVVLPEFVLSKIKDYNRVCNTYLQHTSSLRRAVLLVTVLKRRFLLSRTLKKAFPSLTTYIPFPWELQAACKCRLRPKLVL